MKNFILFLFIFTSSIIYSLPKKIITITENEKSEIIISVDPQMHIDYGFQFPLTYKFSVSDISNGIKIYNKFSIPENWDSLESISLDYYNHHETVRIDSVNNLVFVSVGFKSYSDSIFLKAENNFNENLILTFQEITKFYDNREAAITASADDMAGWSQNKFNVTISNFLQYNLYLTLAMNTNGMSKDTYNFVQNKLNTGFIEAGVHTRTHPGWAAYGDYDSEITGCKNDIINNLEMPELYRSGDREYVYSFIAPNGYFDEIIDSLIGQNKMLVNRLYHNNFFDDFAEWNDESETYFPFTVTRAFDPPASQLGWGIGTNDINNLNSKFDEVTAKGGVYHLMCHPNVMEWDKTYPWEHLEHISNRTNFWYVTLGHLYLYHLAQDNYVYENLVDINEEKLLSTNFTLYQNYPNPFNPTTKIKFVVPENYSNVNLKVFDVLGREIATLLNENKSAGIYDVEFNAKNLNSGIYIYKLQVNSNLAYKKMTYLK
ncbi:MAG: T9SS type A sorting domain-containing protein [Ignavibacteriae bacterium]|nr:T9SS type A sorting domain-containing protein [Ignavibacteriota bacterium]